MPYFVYVLLCNDGTYYTGWTTDIIRRLKEHNVSRGSRYTRARRPLVLQYVEEHDSKESAMRREYEIKQLTREDKMRLWSG